MSDGIQIDLSMQAIKAFCQKWNVREFALFGSVLGSDFTSESDVDVLVTFGPEGGVTFENYPVILDELENIFGRKVDLVEKGTIRNPFRRHAILTSRRVIHAA